MKTLLVLPTCSFMVWTLKMLGTYSSQPELRELNQKFLMLVISMDTILYHCDY